MQIPPVVDLLLARFNGRLLIPFAEALTVLGYNAQTARNQLVRNTFPIPTIKQGARRYIPLTAIAHYLIQVTKQLDASNLAYQGNVDNSEPITRRRGAPTKAERLARHARKGGDQ